ncbi:MAG: hypothetical protein HKN16_00915, partial [Saprospiraceae bacterium]|nr:hypothetical protein [Saprospiraceae bacterium]
MGRLFILFYTFFALSVTAFAFESDDKKDDHSEDGTHHAEYDPGATAFHHIADANVYSIGPFQIPLPCFLYAPGHGWSVFSSSKFD